MTDKEIYEGIRAIVNKPAKKLTSADKAFLLATGELTNIRLEGKENCSRCWHSFAMQIALKIKSQEESANDGRKYVLKPNVDLLFGGVRINAATLTDELAEKIIERGFETKYFERCE